MAKEISTYTHDGMELPFEDWSNTLHSFGDLTSIIQTTHDAALSSAVKAINPNRSLEKVSCHFLMTAIRKTALYMLDS